ncbi:alginate export family protein [Niveibacterium microcysteis]|uniref:Alginate export family protein n=1 Tax=Niveibacterium microcysteis TaxID=2811415 RepID=A0ABX7MF81_9RHOO|nr:alginate export family protein [Niveibacterium microcysteis]QSI78632.1 alginate export family protein [Niveibacterium microcysteis]
MQLGFFFAVGASAVLVLSSSGPVGAETTLRVTTLTGVPNASLPTPNDPYPVSAAGWGPELGRGRFASRWAEDWTAMRNAGLAPPLKAMSLGGTASLTLSAEARWRFNTYDNGQLIGQNDYEQGLFRGVLGVDLRFDPNLRVYGEVATGQVSGRRGAASASMQNDASLQQLFVDVRGHVGNSLLGAMFGRQEFADGPRQLISLSDGPNIHRTWNGVRLYAHDQRIRAGAFDLRVTRPQRGAFDEEINSAERLSGLNASIVAIADGTTDAYVDPFWFHSENPSFRVGNGIGEDDRDTLGVRFWGRRDDVRFDWTLARQTGRFMDREVDAWALFTVQSVALSNQGWRPRLTAHIDLASGGGAYGAGKLKNVNQLYASSGYLGEGQFLSLSNLLMVAPGVAISPTAETDLSVEYGFARRLQERDAAYAGGMRPYAGTQNVPGREIGGLFRVIGSWSVCSQLTVFLNYEHLTPGAVLKGVQRPAGTYAYVGATFRY